MSIEDLQRINAVLRSWTPAACPAEARRAKGEATGAYTLTSEECRLSIEDLQRISAVLRKSRIWDKVCKAFKYWAGEPPGRSLEPLPKGRTNVRNLMKQALGVVQAAARFQGKDIGDREGLFTYMSETTVGYSIYPKKKCN